MAGIIANYIFAYGFITDISNSRYFKGSTKKSDMENLNVVKRQRRFLNEVGWFRSSHEVARTEQSKLYVFGERIISVEDETFQYIDCDYDPEEDMRRVGLYDIKKTVLKAKLKNKEVIDREAELNDTTASFLFFMNDKMDQKMVLRVISCSLMLYSKLKAIPNISLNGKRSVYLTYTKNEKGVI